MAPQVVEQVDVSVMKGDKSADCAPLQLSELRKAIPKEAFEKSLFWSTYYMLFDYTMWLGSVYAIYSLNNSSLWNTMPFWQQAIATLIFWNFAGFFMWCIFVVGHDCGHTNFSNYTLLNDILGHITHGSILVPYYPWQLSHRRHHMYHNHLDKDYSHPWYTEETLQTPKEAMGKLMHDWHTFRTLSPCFGWWLYLFGKPDGSHFIPFPSQRIWRESEGVMEAMKCVLSSCVVVAYFLVIYRVCGSSFSTMGYYYAAPLSIFGWWLTTVTYLQHHNPETVVYDDSNWKFAEAAFETVDRKFGFGIDHFSHHITDGHVAHHLFFTKIPHYNLPMATKAIREYMAANNNPLYKYEETYDFAYRVHKYFLELGYKARLVVGNGIETKKVK